MSFRQATELNAHVRKGEKGSLVVYANSMTRTEQDASGEDSEREIHYMRGYTVFNVEQVEGLPAYYYQQPEVKTTPVERIRHAEEFFKATKAEIRYRGERAYYSCDGDYIQMPVIEAFRDAETFMRRWRTKRRTGRNTPHGSTGISGARAGAMKATRARSW